MVKVSEVKKIEPNYFKGDYKSISHIAERYPQAIKNSKHILRNLAQKDFLQLRIQMKGIVGYAKNAKHFQLYMKQ